MSLRHRSAAAAVLGWLAVLLTPPAAKGADPAVEIRFSEFYIDDFSIEYSDRLRSLAGKQVAIRGFMAPPIKASGEFFVLTREPVQLCPYCESDADWPRDTLVVYLREEGRIDLEKRIRILGTLDVGSKTDPRTGFVSLVRVIDARIER